MGWGSPDDREAGLIQMLLRPPIRNPARRLRECAGGLKERTLMMTNTTTIAITVKNTGGAQDGCPLGDPCQQGRSANRGHVAGWVWQLLICPRKWDFINSKTCSPYAVNQ
jgi:hypothetical protein